MKTRQRAHEANASIPRSGTCWAAGYRMQPAVVGPEVVVKRSSEAVEVVERLFGDAREVRQMRMWRSDEAEAGVRRFKMIHMHRKQMQEKTVCRRQNARRKGAETQKERTVVELVRERRMKRVRR
jgi:hypothetical protein